MARLSERQLRKMPFVFQQCMLEYPRVQPAELGRRAGVSRTTARKHLERLIEEGVLFPPQMRLKNSNQIKEYIYLLRVDNPHSFVPYIEDEQWIFYYCILVGHFNLIFMSYKPVDLSHLKGYKETVISGVRSDYFTPPISERSYKTAYENIFDKCEGKIEPSFFDIRLYDIQWTEELWTLFLDLKYNLRVNFTPLVKKYGFKYTTFYERVKQLLANTYVYVPLYPLGESNYSLFYFLFKTKYQKLIFESFGELPIFSTHLRIKNSLLCRVPIPYGLENDHFRNIISLWEKKGIIDSYRLSMPYTSETIHPGMPCPAPSPPPSGTTP